MTSTYSEIRTELNFLYKYVEDLKGYDEETCQMLTDIDKPKCEIIEDMYKLIDKYEKQLYPSNYPSEDDGMDYDALCRVQGLSRYT